ncbi:hypothetical protein GCM10028864_35940 [Microlunatus parietis]
MSYVITFGGVWPRLTHQAVLPSVAKPTMAALSAAVPYNFGGWAARAGATVLPASVVPARAANPPVLIS